MKTDLSLNSLKAGLFRFLHRYHVIIFVVSAIGGLAIATFMINQVLAAPTTADLSLTNQSGFDAATMEQIRGLKKPGEAAEPLVLPEGRINPFI